MKVILAVVAVVLGVSASVSMAVADNVTVSNPYPSSSVSDSTQPRDPAPVTFGDSNRK